MIVHSGYIVKRHMLSVSGREEGGKSDGGRTKEGSAVHAGKVSWWWWGCEAIDASWSR